MGSRLFQNQNMLENIVVYTVSITFYVIIMVTYLCTVEMSVYKLIILCYV